jgi:hypothetical protein
VRLEHLVFLRHHHSPKRDSIRLLMAGDQSCRLGGGGAVRIKPVPPHFGQSRSAKVY